MRIPRLHVVTNDRVLAAGDFVARATRALEAGGARVALHLRGPASGGRLLWEHGRALAPVARRTGALLLVNDRVDVARLLELDGVHLPEHGLPVSEARCLLPDGAVVGRSLHEPRALEGRERPDLVLVGTLFTTPSHPGRLGAGPGRVTRVRRENPGLPLVGIGGVTLDRVNSVMAAGAHGVALLRAVWDHARPEEAVAEYLEAVYGQIGPVPEPEADHEEDT